MTIKGKKVKLDTKGRVTLKLKPKMAKLVRTNRAARKVRARAKLKGVAKPATKTLSLKPAATKKRGRR